MGTRGSQLSVYFTHALSKKTNLLGIRLHLERTHEISTDLLTFLLTGVHALSCHSQVATSRASFSPYLKQHIHFCNHVGTWYIFAFTHSAAQL